MRDLMNRIETAWCEQMHTAVMWPIHGKYRCGTCMREYAVASRPWSGGKQGNRQQCRWRPVDGRYG